jgi:hypothetical protein
VFVFLSLVLVLTLAVRLATGSCRTGSLEKLGTASIRLAVSEQAGASLNTSGTDTKRERAAKLLEKSSNHCTPNIFD